MLAIVLCWTMHDVRRLRDTTSICLYKSDTMLWEYCQYTLDGYIVVEQFAALQPRMLAQSPFSKRFNDTLEAYG